MWTDIKTTPSSFSIGVSVLDRDCCDWKRDVCSFGSQQSRCKTDTPIESDDGFVFIICPHILPWLLVFVSAYASKPSLDFSVIDLVPRHSLRSSTRPRIVHYRLVYSMSYDFERYGRLLLFSTTMIRVTAPQCFPRAPQGTFLARMILSREFPWAVPWSLHINVNGPCNLEDSHDYVTTNCRNLDRHAATLLPWSSCRWCWSRVKGIASDCLHDSFGSGVFGGGERIMVIDRRILNAIL